MKSDFYKQSAKSKEKQASVDLECEICFMNYSSPVATIPCLHIFCEKCIVGW